MGSRLRFDFVLSLAKHTRCKVEAMHILRARREEVQEAATGSTADIEYSAVQRRVMNEFPQGPSSDELQERILVPVKAILIVYGGVPGIVDLGCSTVLTSRPLDMDSQFLWMGRRQRIFRNMKDS